MISRVLATMSLPLFNSVEASYARGRSARWSTRGVCGGVHGRGRNAGLTAESAVLFRMLPGVEMVVVDIDAIVALMGVVYCGQDGSWLDEIAVSAMTVDG